MQLMNFQPGINGYVGYGDIVDLFVLDTVWFLFPFSASINSGSSCIFSLSAVYS